MSALVKLIYPALLALLAGQGAEAGEYQLRISKQDNELIVERAGARVKTYRIASGRGGRGAKRRQGDNKTPVGAYRILNGRESARFDYFIHLDYPNLIDAWRGYKDKVISAAEFKQIALAHKQRRTPPQDTGLGGFIGIHGLGRTDTEKLAIHEGFNWTEGCIALTNEEIRELRQFIQPGTTVIIRP